MKQKILLTIVITSLFSVTACGHKKMKKDKAEAAETVMAYPAAPTKEGLDKLTQFWPESSKAAITSLQMKYGMPTAATDEMIVWEATAPFKRSVVYREEVDHQFPVKHADVLVQTIDYRVPANKILALSQFDGSLLVDRTKGELSARNSSEDMNILTFNLADKVARGAMTAEQARREYSKNAEIVMAGKSTALMSGLNFMIPSNTSDPDYTMQSQEMDGKHKMKKNYKK